MAYKFNCAKCGEEMQVRWLRLGELAKCRGCGASMAVPQKAAVIADEFVPLPAPKRGGDEGPGNPCSCATCKYLERMGTADQEESPPAGVLGFCHRYPPSAVGEVKYPFVTASDWCAEHKGQE